MGSLVFITTLFGADEPALLERLVDGGAALETAGWMLGTGGATVRGTGC